MQQETIISGFGGQGTLFAGAERVEQRRTASAGE